jgi:hypothetical protein
MEVDIDRLRQELNEIDRERQNVRGFVQHLCY